MLSRVVTAYGVTLLEVVDAVIRAAGAAWFFVVVLQLSTQNSVLSALLLVAALELAGNYLMVLVAWYESQDGYHGEG